MRGFDVTSTIIEFVALRGSLFHDSKEGREPGFFAPKSELSILGEVHLAQSPGAGVPDACVTIVLPEVPGEVIDLEAVLL